MSSGKFFSSRFFRRALAGLSLGLFLGFLFHSHPTSAEDKEHLVAEGDTLYAIARLYQVSLDVLMQTNSLDASGRIAIGQKLRIPQNVEPASETTSEDVSASPSPAAAPAKITSGDTAGARQHTVAPGETLFAIARMYNRNPFALAKLNNLDDPSKLLVGTVLRLSPATPEEKPAAPSPTPTKAQDPALPASPDRTPLKLRWPLKGTVVRSFGDSYIAGGKKTTSPCLEIAASGGTEVLAAADGLVLSAGWMKGYGNAVYLHHEGGIATFYGNCGIVFCTKGQKVFRGDRIAEVGKPPAGATQSVLSFTVLQKGKAVDPKPYLQ